MRKIAPRLLNSKKSGGAAGAVMADAECTLSSLDRACDDDGSQYTCGSRKGRTRRGRVCAGNRSRISRVFQFKNRTKTSQLQLSLEN